MSAYSDKVLADGALGYWRLNDASGDALDSSGAGRTLTVTGTPTYRSVGATSDGDSGVLFPGGGTDEFARSDAALRPTAAVTLEFWYKPTAFPTVQYLVACGDTGNNGYRFHSDNTALVIFTVGNGSANTALGAGTMVIGRWHHLVGTYDGTNVRSYLNGALLAGPTALTGPIGYGAIVQFVVGQYESPTAARQTAGTLDEVAVYGAALSATQVKAHYELGVLRGINEHLQIYFKTVLYPAGTSNDLTTSLMRRVSALTGDVTARIKAIIVSSGTKN
jgi:hypothetical protein